jgi:hypothetical protein
LLHPAAQEIHRLENEGDDLLADAIATLYDGVTEVPRLIHAMRWSDVYQLLEDTTDKAEHVATVQTIGSASMGVGATRRLSAVRWGIAGQIIMGWVFTIPACFILAWVVQNLLELMGAWR